MIGLQQDGHPPVKRFVSGHFYHLQWPDGYWKVLKFRRQGWSNIVRRNSNESPKKIYHFIRVAEPHTSAIFEHLTIRGSIVETLSIRRIEIDDLALFVGADSTFPALAKAFREYGDETAHRKLLFRKRRKSLRIKR